MFCKDLLQNFLCLLCEKKSCYHLQKKHIKCTSSFSKNKQTKKYKNSQGEEGRTKKKQKHIYIKKKFFDKYDLEKNILIKKIDKEKKARGRMGG